MIQKHRANVNPDLRLTPKLNLFMLKRGGGCVPVGATVFKIAGGRLETTSVGSTPIHSRMRLSLALLADYANVSHDGKLNIMGIFGQIHAPQFPAVHAQMHLVLSLE